jgi:hypothetical protein
MKNSANEAKKMWLETFHIKDQIDYVAMDSKADNSNHFREYKRQRKVNLITSCRQNMDKSKHRKKMIKFMKKPRHKKIYRERAFKVEPMQGLVKVFAAMGLTIQMHQLEAFKLGKSTWNIKDRVLE